MSGYRTAEEVERTHLEVLGPVLGPLYHALHNEVAWIHAKWLEYRKLYAKSEERIDLLNETAGFFFRVVQDTLWENVLLHIARLTDPPKQREFENLSLLRLPRAVEDTQAALEIDKLLEIVKSRAEFARNWRNRHIAHRDLYLALNKKAQPLADASRQHVEDVLESFREVLNLIQRRYFGGETAYQYFHALGDADALVSHLSLAVWLEEKRMERFRGGNHSPEDYEYPPKV